MNKASIIRLFSEKNIPAGASITSDDIDIFTLTGWYAKKLTHLNGYFCLEIKASGSGVLSLEYESSLSGNTFMTPEGEQPLLTGFTETDGANGDGAAIFQFSPHFARRIRLKASETGGADALTLTAYIGIL